MDIGFIGLGKMGSRMAERLLDQGCEVVIYARNPDSMVPLSQKGAIAANSYQEFCSKLPSKKIIFLMVTHGKAVDEVIAGLLPFLSAGDIIVDGGNSFYKDSIRRAKQLSKKGIEFLDAGTSGGLDGARNGASIMVGGNDSAFRKAEPVFAALSVPNGYALLGPSGSGHYAKMAHNGIEYCFLQSLGEGYELLEKSGFNYDLRQVTKVYRNGSVIRGWLVDLLARALEKDPKLDGFSGTVGGGSTGEWTLRSAKDAKVKMPSLQVAMKERARSQKTPRFNGKVVAALRYEFGGHEEPKRPVKKKAPAKK
ncbi:MAG TPA: decarboxylating 6-phosphogluconate dehydrogenase [Candidatus Diapherotrites archaeon]|uniref:Decarboxylating 6-phosphogluconate dehydrogenase n=1 Tax=Candidatus Iainarchaeum sp. TaxID=3101447 RepID=A0A7J4J0R9_9ARCH|nr:decarboxylating 6-phosphogluconate dehydrogenase [Candidatus Diapherotrites archaeon]